jgi:hypothetical protein
VRRRLRHYSRHTLKQKPRQLQLRKTLGSPSFTQQLKWSLPLLPGNHQSESPPSSQRICPVQDSSPGQRDPLIAAVALVVGAAAEDEVDAVASRQWLKPLRQLPRRGRFHPFR